MLDRKLLSYMELINRNSLCWYVMPPKKRQQTNLPKRRQSKRMRPSDLTETAPETEHTSLAAANSNTANLMAVDVNALTLSISLAVTEAVQRAFEKFPQKQVDKCQQKPTGVEAVVDEEVSLLTESTPPSTSSNPIPLPGRYWYSRSSR